MGAGGLWFDVGVKRYTTRKNAKYLSPCCGLMQESKDIQQVEMMFHIKIVVV